MSLENADSAASCPLRCAFVQGVVLLDEHFLRATWPMWELGTMIAALPDHASGQPQPDDAAGLGARVVLPVVLMDWKDFDAIKALYVEHWTPAVSEAARCKGLQPATLSDLQRLLSYQGIRQNQVRLSDLLT